MPKQLLDILQQKLIPWLDRFALTQMVVARKELAEMRPRSGFDYSSRELLGPRRGVRSFSFNRTVAIWPRDHLVEIANPLLTFVVEGRADMPFKDYWLHARQGQGVFIPSHTPRKDGTVPYLHPMNQQSGYCSTLNFTEVRGVICIWRNTSRGKEHISSPESKPVYSLSNHAVQLFEQMQYHFSEMGSEDEAICEHLLKAFLRTLEKELQEERYLQTGPSWVSHFPDLNERDSIEEAKKYIRSHLHEPLTLQSVAHQFCMSRTQFAARFHQETGLTFNDFVTRCRIERAKVLLRETECTLTFICHNIGFRSLTYFRRLFIRKVGVPPLEYRENHHHK